MLRKTAITTGLLLSALALATPASAAGDAAKGKKAFNKCKACHTVKAGKHKTGPSLAGVVGRKAGTADGFTRYKGLKGADWTWDDATLDAYLNDPKKFTKAKTGKNSAMVVKTRKKSTRADLIAYLKTLK